MSIQEILEELADKVYAQATAKIKALMLECLPEPEDLRYCEIDAYTKEELWELYNKTNQALNDIKEKVEQL